MNDSENLIEKIRNGESSALLDYLELRREDLTLFIKANLGTSLRGKLEPDDIIQEISTYAHNNFAEMNFSEQDPFGWFCQIARRKVADAGRHFTAQKRSSNREVAMHGATPSMQQGIEKLLVASITSPSRAFSRKQKEFKLLSALSKMSEEQQKVLNLRYAENLPTKDIAVRIGKTDGATRVLLTRSLKKLEKLMTHEMENDG